MSRAPRKKGTPRSGFRRLLLLALLLLAGWLALSPQSGLRPPDQPPDAPRITIPERPPTRPSQPLPLPQTQTVLRGSVDHIEVQKSARRMVVYRDGRALKTYRIGLGFAPRGDKTKQGDGRTPEGVFRIDRRNDASAYHLSLGIDYPRADDRARAKAAGVNPGGDIFIHGQPNALPDGVTLPGDWTAGCIAISNAEIEELFAAVAVGTKVEILP